MSLESGIELSDSETPLKIGEIILEFKLEFEFELKIELDFALDFELVFKRQVVVSVV